MKLYVSVMCAAVLVLGACGSGNGRSDPRTAPKRGTTTTTTLSPAKCLQLIGEVHSGDQSMSDAMYEEQCGPLPAGVVLEPTTTTTLFPPSTLAPPVTTTTVAPPPTTPPTSAGLSTAATCSAYFDIVGDFTMSDEQSAAQLSALAGRTSNAGLADALNAMASAFSRHDSAIPSGAVQAYC